MADVIVTIPMRLWQEWIEEGDLPGDAATGEEYAYWLGGSPPHMRPGDRVYICAYGKMRGYAPLTRIVGRPGGGGFGLCRCGGAVACTIDEPITGFRGFRYVWWPREAERPFPDWRAQ